MLYVVSTPIGNLEDISPRAIQVLSDVYTILAEDTRHTARLLQHYDIRTPMLSYHQHSQLKRVDHILALLREHDLALVSDAGTPAISDPGSELISLAVAQGERIVPIPGASASITALICSGFDIDRFVFLGYLPRKAGRQQKMIKEHLSRRCPVIFYESPYRIQKTLENLAPLFKDKQIAIGRELTKKFEEFLRGSARELLDILNTKQLKGELTVIVE